jgi:hypothetical protein
MNLKSFYNEDIRNIRHWREHKLAGIKRLNRDIRRRLKVHLKDFPLNTAQDHYLAAHIYQHSFTITGTRKALVHAKKAVALGKRNAKWLIAAATDRLLQLQGKRQRFGTQAVDMDAKRLKQYKTDPRTTDEESRAYGLPPLRELKRLMEKG